MNIHPVVRIDIVHDGRPTHDPVIISREVFTLILTHAIIRAREMDSAEALTAIAELTALLLRIENR